MKKSGIVIAAIAILILIVGGILIAVSHGGKQNENAAVATATIQPTVQPTAKPVLKNMCDIVLEPSATEVSAGDKLSIKVMMKNVKNQLGIGAILATLDYDKNVFEQVTQDMFVKGEGWDAPVYNSQNEKEGMLFTLTETAVNMKEDNLIFTIEMKVLDNVAAQDTSIKLTEISTSDGEQDIYNDDVALTINVK